MSPRVSIHPPDGYNQSSDQDIVTGARARSRDTHKGLLRREWMSRPVAQDREGWRHGLDSPSLPSGEDISQEAQHLPEDQAEDEAEEGSSSPVSLGP